ncbi:BrnA antitoxin family protein [Devosia aurantiaca]|uniref:BrnA antitoxin family protein n=1 Tax=Devosia aurantiaca TaxID=2714858 RepID=A0A6M1SUK2_9HYPH|nr:BrnA antitoxin family protein [Devosia aurantiaca]NGP18063.1 BrnA antitoxin family protein [Devosia aurantiaca]
MSSNPSFDDDNPEWTEADFARAKPAHDVLPEEVLKSFPKTRGVQRLPKKIPVSIRLSPEVIERFKAQGPGWQTRIDEILKKAVGL